MKTLSAGPSGIRQAGAAVEVSDAEGKALVAGGYADVIEAPKKAKKAKAEETDTETTDPDTSGEGADA